ncbi:MarR family winged helix-turn-helix transcriptional regulator [uncultured Demequina sp.]|uniref:MarR family winged helix-turn-helix transcriptional regulator n=1 Tax=uncultured Demequina sp. TaxID=693499 RepID=UPI0025D8F188|nr:MarR family transcriptional regulator [uncultured Demequina sp.]
MSDKLTFTLHELVQVLDQSADSLLTSKYGVTGSQFVFLATLEDVEPTDVTTLAECLGVSKAAVSKRVPSLADAGWITTADDPHHKRRVVLTVTQRGRDLVERAGRDLDAQFTALFQHPAAAGLDPRLLKDQLNTLISILRQNGPLS